MQTRDREPGDVKVKDKTSQQASLLYLTANNVLLMLDKPLTLLRIRLTVK